MCKAVGIHQTAADPNILDRLAALLKKYDTGSFLPRAVTNKTAIARTEDARILTFVHYQATKSPSP